MSATYTVLSGIHILSRGLWTVLGFYLPSDLPREGHIQSTCIITYWSVGRLEQGNKLHLGFLFLRAGKAMPTILKGEHVKPEDVGNGWIP